MAISFRNIPSNLRVPLAYFEFDPTMAGSATALQRALILCTVQPGAPLLPGVPTQVVSADHARSLAGSQMGPPPVPPATTTPVRTAGAGSALGRQAEAWFKNNASVPLFALAAVEPSAPATPWTRSVGNIVWGGTAEESGSIALYIGGRLCRIIVASGDDQDAIAVACAAAINADPRLGVSAAVDGTDAEQVNITAAQAGALGRLKLQFNLAGPIGGEITPPGVTHTVTAMTAVAGSPDVTDLLSTIGDAPFDYVLCPWTAAADLNALDEFFNDTTGRWSWQSMLYGHGWTAVEGTHAQLSTLGGTRNGQHVSIFGFNNSATPADEWMAAYAGEGAGSLIVDPARPIHGLPLQGVHPPPVADRFTKIELQVLYFTGISSYEVNDSATVMTNRVITTYRRNVWGAPDDSYLDVETMYTAAEYARSARNRILIKFPRSKLANDGTRFGAGQAIVTPSIIRAELIAHYGELLEDRGLVENIEAFERELIVERNATDPNRVDALLPPDLVNQLRIFAALTQFRLMSR